MRGMARRPSRLAAWHTVLTNTPALRRQVDAAAALAAANYLECSDPAVASRDFSLPQGADVVVTGVLVAAGAGRAACRAPLNATGAAQVQQHSCVPCGGSTRESAPACQPAEGACALLTAPRACAAAGANNATASSSTNATSAIAGSQQGGAAAALEAFASFEPANLVTNVMELQVHCVHKGAVTCRAGGSDPEDVCTILVEAPAGEAGGAAACGLVQDRKYMLMLAGGSSGVPAAADRCDGMYGTM